jgi:hypothetical protein
MTGPEPATPVADFRLALPLAWVELDLNPATRAEAIARILDERGAAGQALGLSRAQLADMLESIAAQAEAKNGVYAAFYSDILEDKPVSASLIVSMVPATGGPPPPGSDAMSVAKVLQQMFPPENDTELRQIATGPALRVRRRLEAPISGVGTVSIEDLQYIVVLPDLTRLAVLDFSTPTIGLADLFVELFDAIAGTLELQ